MMRLPFALLVLVLLIQSACFEPASGCLDIEATNFDASADKDCCCEYPQLILDVVQNYGAGSFQENKPYPAPYDTNHLFKLNSIVFYLSEFQLIQNGQTYTVSDSVQLRAFGANVQDTVTNPFIDDFLLIRRLSLSNNVGTFRQNGNFDAARFRLGLSAATGRVIAPLAPAGHPLRTQTDSLWFGPAAGYVFARIVLTRDTFSTTIPDTISLTRADLGDFFLQSNGAVQHTTGADFRLRLLTDYQALMTGVNLTVHDISAWKTQIIANLTNVFSVSQ